MSSVVDYNCRCSAATYKYDPFGTTLAQSGTLASANVYRFSSKEFHLASSLYYYGFRLYDPNLQRWLNRDSIQEEGGLNLYGFVDNDPNNNFDPNGQFTCVVPTLAGVLKAAAGTNAAATAGATVVATTAIGVGSGAALAAGYMVFPPPQPINWPPTLPGLINGPPTSKTVPKPPPRTLPLPEPNKPILLPIPPIPTEKPPCPTFYHYSQSPPENFRVNGLVPPAWLTTLSGLDSKSAMFGFAIKPPTYEYQFRINPTILGPPDIRTPGGWSYVQYA